MLRDSMRGFLEARWPASSAVARSASPEALAALWDGLVGQGIASLGSEPTEGGLREVAIVMEELGRAACPAPMLGAALANLAFGGGCPNGARRAPNPAAGSTSMPAAGGAGSTAGSKSEPPSTDSELDGAAAALLDRVHGGSARFAFAFGALDPDRQAGAVTLTGAAATGTLRFVDAAPAATHLLIASAAPAGLVIVEAAAPGMEIVPTRALGGDGLAEVRLERVPCAFVSLTRESLADLQHLARLALLARAHGAARRAFEMVVDYAKERRQFGQPIGRFQAIQHKLANGLIALEGVRLTLEHAAAAFDEGVGDWRYFAAAAAAFGGPALRQVSLETHHAFGAIGYAEDHEAPRHFRRVHLDTLALGGPAPAREALAAHLLDAPDGALPEYDLGEAGNAFRSTVRD